MDSSCAGYTFKETTSLLPHSFFTSRKVLFSLRKYIIHLSLSIMLPVRRFAAMAPAFLSCTRHAPLYCFQFRGTTTGGGQRKLSTSASKKADKQQTPDVQAAAGAAAAWCLRLADDQIFDESTNEELAYVAGGFLSCRVAAQYTEENGLAPEEATEMVAKGIRAFLCCEDKDLDVAFSGFPHDPLQVGLFYSTETWRSDHRKTVKVSITAAQQVMASIGYGSLSHATTNTTCNPFGVLSASFLLLFLGGYSTNCFKREDGKKIVLSSDATLSTFLNSVSATKVKGTYTNLLKHKCVSDMLFSPLQMDKERPLGWYWSFLANCLGKDNEQAFVLVNGRNAPYADVIAKSGDILFLIHCQEDAETTEMNVPAALEKMGFSSSDSPAVDAFVKGLDMNGPNLAGQLDHFMDKSAPGKSKSGSDKKVGSQRLLRGKLLTRLLMKTLGCKVAVPVLMCDAPKHDHEKTEWVQRVEKTPFQSFGWNDPAALLFVGDSITRSAEISV
ncbi:hypothetical protein AGDE_16263 [Angomonas deanei]|nr:hypothetical protein AGDE_16263 [Angomonas deanei]|eukprot:EPY17415.1 hypothetical protein AGDE_16263 [Angomonas deanei]